jgi:hypothetical protein
MVGYEKIESSTLRIELNSSPNRRQKYKKVVKIAEQAFGGDALKARFYRNFYEGS